MSINRARGFILYNGILAYFLQALIHGLNRHYYSISINYRKNELEQKMLLNLHKKSWMDGLILDNYIDHCKTNETTVNEMLELAKSYNKVGTKLQLVMVRLTYYLKYLPEFRNIRKVMCALIVSFPRCIERRTYKRNFGFFCTTEVESQNNQSHRQLRPSY